jgi:hypothetical protein
VSSFTLHSFVFLSMLAHWWLSFFSALCLLGYSWRTRDMDGNLFRGSKSTSPIDEAPPRDAASIKRYAQHLPFQVFCCESGVHIIDPSQSFYQGISYRSSIEHGIFNISAAEDGKAPKWSEGPCMDSAQMHFCRDLWMLSAREGVIKDAKKAHERERKGLSRGLTDEMEKIVKVIAPNYIPVDKSSGGYFGFGRKKPSIVQETVKDEDDWDDEDDDGDEGTGPGAAGSAESSTDSAGKDNKKDKEPEVVQPPKKEETQAEKEEKKEQAMAADAAAAALPMEEQHPPEGVDAGAAIKEGEDKKGDDKKKKKAKDDAAAAKAEEQFVDPEALLALEEEKLAKDAAAGAAGAGEPGAADSGEKKEAKLEKDTKKEKKAKKAKRDGKAVIEERAADGPAAANPAVQKVDKEDITPKQPPSVNNPEESDSYQSWYSCSFIAIRCRWSQAKSTTQHSF